MTYVRHKIKVIGDVFGVTFSLKKYNFIEAGPPNIFTSMLILITRIDSWNKSLVVISSKLATGSLFSFYVYGSSAEGANK